MKSRPYTMRARAQSAGESHRRILQAGSELMWEKLSTEITLDAIAARARVTVQTILRHFGTREKLLEAVRSFLHEQIMEERQAPVGDLEAAVRIIVDHYEGRGDAVMRLLGQEPWDDHIRTAMDEGRRTHREWVAQVFEPWLAKHSAAERDELTDLLVVATDVYTWKLLRRDRALTRQQTEGRMTQLLTAILARKSEEQA